MGKGMKLGRDFYTRDGITVARELLGKILVHETALGTVRGIITETESYMGEEDRGAHTYGGRRTQRTEPMYHIGGTSYVYLIYGMYSCMNIAAMTEGIPQAVLIRKVEPADEESRHIMEQLRLRQNAGRRGARGREDKAEPGQAVPERTLPGQAVSGQAEPGQTMPGQTVLGQTEPGQAVPGQVVPEQTVSGQAEPEQTEPGQVVPGQTVSGQVVPEQTASGQAETVHSGAGSDKAAQEIPASIRKHLADGPGKMCIAMEITRDDNDMDMVESNTFYVTEGIKVEQEQIKAGKRIGIDYAEEAADYLWRFYI